MKKIITIALAVLIAISMLSLTAMAATMDDYESYDKYELTEGAEIGFWLAIVTNVGGLNFECYSEDYYVAATFTAEKPFSAIGIPFWSGDPNAFGGIVPCDVEFALFKAVDNNYGEDYKSEDAVVLLNKTCDHDETRFVWEFDQQPAGRYCLRISQLTEEGAYIVIAQGEPVDDDAEFDVESVAQNTLFQEGVALTIYYDAEGTVPSDPTDVPADPTEVPATDVPVDPTEVPATDVPVDPTEVPATDVPATDVPVEPTDVPATDAPATEKAADPTTDSGSNIDDTKTTDSDKKSFPTGAVIGIIAGAVVVAAVIACIVIMSKKKK